MEKEKENYLHYFQKPQPLKNNQYHQNMKKLPQLTSKYEINCNNQIILGKIMKPKRDKIITNSFRTNINLSKYDRNKEKDNIINSRKNINKKKINQENQKLGTRIINTKSVIQKQIQNTYSSNYSMNIQKKSNSLHTRINNGIRLFFNSTRNQKSNINNKIYLQEQQKLIRKKKNQLYPESILQKHQEVNLLGCTKLYGKGSVIIALQNIKIDCHPALQFNTLLILELMDIEANSHKIKIQGNTKQKIGISTLPVQYEYISKNSIKFAIKTCEVGDFIPLKVWIISGVNSRLLGIIDIDLLMYKHRRQFKKQIESSETYPCIVQKTKLKNKMNVHRQILINVFNGFLRKQMKDTIDIKMQFNYKIYSKKFIPY